MIYKNETIEKSAVFRCAEMMAVAARTAPKALGVDLIETLILDGEDKDKLVATMKKIGEETNRSFFIRDAGNIDRCPYVMFVGSDVKPRGLNCGLCGVKDCGAAASDGIACALSVNDLGIALGSAAATAMDCRVDNRMLFTAGMAALEMKIFGDNIKICFGFGLSASGKNIFFDRPVK